MNCLGKGSRVPCSSYLHCFIRSPCFKPTWVWEGGELSGQGVQRAMQFLPHCFIRSPCSKPTWVGREVNCLGKGSRVPCSSYLHCSIRFPCSRPTWVTEGGELPGEGVQGVLQFLSALLYQVLPASQSLGCRTRGHRSHCR